VSLAVYGGFSPDSVDWQVLLVLAALAFLAERFDMNLYGDSRVSLAFVPIFAAVLISGMTGLALVVPIAILASAHSRSLYKTAFNFGALMAAGAVAYLILYAFGISDHAHSWPQVLLPVILAGGANFVVNSALVAIAISLNSGTNARSVWREHFLWLFPHYLLLAVMALAIVAAYETMGLWGIAVFVAPTLMMRFTVKQYLDRTTESVLELREAHTRLQEAHTQLKKALATLDKSYDGTLRSLVAALDARDSETAGHSERVADLTMAIAEEMGIQPYSDEWRWMSWGALLHDVGKIAIPDEILRKPGVLTDSEWEAMRTHPRTGFDILKSVDFLAPAAEIVLSHHERYDGTGYPRGLAGDEIPIGARIFMIADAFDAMTSNRAYRSAMPAEEALAEILRNSGSQFDPAAVKAFLSVYQKRFVSHSTRRAPGHHLADNLKKAILEAAGLE
jgi:putative nucleotidyltransferase with HDIG domain